MERPRSVALIDDDSTQLQLMKAQLTSLGGNVTTFESGDAFLRHRRIGSVWDLIVVSAPRSRCLFGRSVASKYAVWQADYLMPRLNGVETIGQLGGDVLAQTNVYLVSGIDTLRTQEATDGPQTRSSRPHPSAPPGSQGCPR